MFLPLFRHNKTPKVFCLTFGVHVNACIRTFAKRFNLSIQASHEYLESYKGIDFLIEFYEVEHLQSLDDAVDDLIVCCQNNGGYLKQ